ncbi:MAG: fructosamine kinase family protein [Alphaproteobacteria bacterium]
MRQEITDAIIQATGSVPVRTSALGGGCISDVYKVALENGKAVVAKVGGPDPKFGTSLELEGRMLQYLRDHSALPVPDVLSADDGLLLMTYMKSGGALNGPSQIHAADLLAHLHDITADAYGFECDTVIGGLHQPNPETASWLDFFSEHRLLSMGRDAEAAGRLPGAVMTRLEKFARNIGQWLEEPARPSLIHGDMWGGNVLASGGRITGFIDPAIYFADAEIELAFSTLFGTFGDDFFARYNEHRPIAPGFFEERRDLYNLYPLLVHVRLFGGSYVNSVDGTLKKFGF